jgi:predicted nucleic acid-binding protein
VLADTSVLHRVRRHPQVAERVADLRRRGELWTCDVVTLELGYSARNQTEWTTIVAAQRRLNQAPVDGSATSRALEVQGRLTELGRHRVKLPDLLVAASAEAAGVPLLHYDADFDVIASVTGQPVEWVVERGSID